MKIDFHTHGKLAKKLPFSIPYTNWLFDEAKRAGLDALCLTEHFNTLQFDEVYGYILSISRREGDSLVLPNGLRLFAGMETDIAEGGHILSIGPVEEILALNRSLTPNKEPGHFLPFRDLMACLRQAPVLVGGAHPFRAGGHIPDLPARGPDAPGLPGPERQGPGPGPRADRAEDLCPGRAAAQAVVSGSDTHQAVQYGCVVTEFPGEIVTLSDLYAQMLAGNYHISLSEEAPFRVRTATVLKRALKEIHALGGDYVQVLLSVQ